MKKNAENQVKMSEYNHALFQNMVSCLTSIWEINVPVNKAWVMYDRFNERVNGREFNYLELLDTFANKFVGKECYHFFMSKMSLDVLRNMTKEVIFECPLTMPDKEVRQFRFTLTPGERVNGVLESVYFSSIDLKTEAASMLGELKESNEKLMADRDLALKESTAMSVIMTRIKNEAADPLNKIDALINEIDNLQDKPELVSENIKKIQENLIILRDIYDSLDNL